MNKAFKEQESKLQNNVLTRGCWATCRLSDLRAPPSGTTGSGHRESTVKCMPTTAALVKAAVKNYEKYIVITISLSDSLGRTDTTMEPSCAASRERSESLFTWTVLRRNSGGHATEGSDTCFQTSGEPLHAVFEVKDLRDFWRLRCFSHRRTLFWQAIPLAWKQ